MIFCRWLLSGALALGTSMSALAEAPEALRLDVTDFGELSSAAPRIKPWKSVTLDSEYGGQWVLASDLDGDGEVEIVSAQNVNRVGPERGDNNSHYTSTAVAQRLDGTVLWRWGDPTVGQKTWGYDVACQVYDWDGDGRPEVLLCTTGALVELDGVTGEERRRIEIPDEATDCLVFCNLGGGKRATDVLVKDRYRTIWAYDFQGRLLWKVTDPGGYRTAHQPRPIDLDHDGRDEIMAGFAMLNHDGSVRWTLTSNAVDLRRGHLDCCRVLESSQELAGFRILLSCCGARNLALVDGQGRLIWEVPGVHFESISVGHLFPDGGASILVDDGSWTGTTNRSNPLWILDATGKRTGRIATKYSRHHKFLDWTGDGLAEVLVAENGAIYSHRGECVAVLECPRVPADSLKFEQSILVGDMTGDARPDVMLVTPYAVHIFRNDQGTKIWEKYLGTERNLTLY